MSLFDETKNQREAVETDAENVVCAAGPGSGKSSTVVSRIHNLIAHGTKASEIAALSFTNAGSRVLQERLELGDVELGANSTLHAFALRMLKRHGARFGYGEKTAMISPDSAEDLMATKADSLGCKTPLEKLLKLKSEKGRPARGKRLTLDETVVATYLDELKEAGVVDYDALLQEFRAMLTEDGPGAMSAQQSIGNELSHLFVDEAQDSNPLHWEIYRALPIRNKFYVGDSDQNLYEWNGARLKEFVDEAAKPETKLIKLEENFRSVPEICEAAQRLIERNVNRIDKKTLPTRGSDPGKTAVSGPHELENEGEEIASVARTIKSLFLEGIPVAEVAVLARTNAVAEGFRRTLPNMGVPVVETKTMALPKDWPYARALIELNINPDNDALAYFYLVAYNLRKGQKPADARKNAQAIRVDANAEGKTINKHLLNLEPITRPQSVLGALTGAGVSRESYMIAVEKFRELPPGATLEEFSVALASVSDYSKSGNLDGITVSTVHGAKGREFDAVFVVGCEDESYPGRDDPEEARRVLFVAITRARRYVAFSSVKTRVTKWKEVVNRTPSRFLKEVFA